MEQTLKQMMAKFDQLTSRERVLMILGIMALGYFLADLYMLGPEAAKQKAFLQQAKAHKRELAAVNKEIGLVSTLLAQDPLAKDKSLRDSLKKTIVESDMLLGDATKAQVGALLKQMIATTPGLTLVSLKTLPVTTFLVTNNAPAANDKIVPDAQAAAAKPALAVYKQGIEVAIKGHYLDLLPYLDKLQKYPKQLFWGDARLNVAAYPEVVFTVVIYTLSEQSGSPLG